MAPTTLVWIAVFLVLACSTAQAQIRVLTRGVEGTNDWVLATEVLTTPDAMVANEDHMGFFLSTDGNVGIRRTHSDTFNIAMQGSVYASTNGSDVSLFLTHGTGGTAMVVDGPSMFVATSRFQEGVTAPLNSSSTLGWSGAKKVTVSPLADISGTFVTGGSTTCTGVDGSFSMCIEDWLGVPVSFAVADRTVVTSGSKWKYTKSVTVDKQVYDFDVFAEFENGKLWVYGIVSNALYDGLEIERKEASEVPGTDGVEAFSNLAVFAKTPFHASHGQASFFDLSASGTTLLKDTQVEGTFTISGSLAMDAIQTDGFTSTNLFVNLANARVAGTILATGYLYFSASGVLHTTTGSRTITVTPVASSDPRHVKNNGPWTYTGSTVQHESGEWKIVQQNVQINDDLLPMTLILKPELDGNNLITGGTVSGTIFSQADSKTGDLAIQGVLHGTASAFGFTIVDGIAYPEEAIRAKYGKTYLQEVDVEKEATFQAPVQIGTTSHSEAETTTLEVRGDALFHDKVTVQGELTFPNLPESKLIVESTTVLTTLIFSTTAGGGYIDCSLEAYKKLLDEEKITQSAYDELVQNLNLHKILPCLMPEDPERGQLLSLECDLRETESPESALREDAVCHAKIGTEMVDGNPEPIQQEILNQAMLFLIRGKQQWRTVV